jgi:hypothetical protein
MAASNELTIQTPIPTGSWTLYFHAAEETKWTLNTFIKIGTMTTWNHFWAIMDALNIDSFSDGMFFMMRDPSPPLWESHYHIRGGCYSFRCHKKNAANIFVDYVIASMINCASTNPENYINGLSISPKRGFNIIKVWNGDSQKHNRVNEINTELNSVQAADIIYTPFVQNKMY